MPRQLLVIIAILVFGNDSAFACSCVGQEDVERARKKADAVVLGTVVAEERVEVTDPAMLTHFPVFVKRFTLQIERSFKGGTVADTVIVVTGMGNGDCGFEFAVGKRYVVYASRDAGNQGQLLASKPLTGRGVFWTNICTRTKTYDESEVKELEHLK